MKPYWLILLAVLLLALPVSANTALNFQQPADFTAQVSTFGSGAVTWYESLNGGNSYIVVSNNCGGGGCGATGIQPTGSANPMQYSAATITMSGTNPHPGVWLFDSTHGSLWKADDFTWGGFAAGNGRYEMKMIGMQAYLYRDGVQLANSTVLSQYPSWVGWYVGDFNGFVNGGTIDDVVWGSSEPLSSTASDKYVYGMPETASDGSPYYILMKDFLNPAANGFYFGNGTLISSNSFTTTFSKGNGNNDTIYLQGYSTGVNVLPAYTGTAFTGTITWNLSQFFSANPNYGSYADHSESSLKYSDLIFYTGNGATISWDQSTYSQGESGSVLTSVSAGGYWDPATYDYRVDVIDVYGVVDATYPVTTQTQTTSHTWDADQDIGAYYAAIIATPKAGGDDIWMAVALTNVDAYLHMSGYVLNAENATAIRNATVNITQGISINNRLTPSDGNYSVTGLAQGGAISIRVNATGYENYTHQFTPLRVGQLHLNFTLMPLSPTFTGNAIGGIAYEPPYNRTIPTATIEIQNGTDYNSTTTNTVGYYIKNDLTEAIDYTIHGSKTGFLNSSDYHKMTAAGWNRQDVIMQGMYTLQVAFQDSVSHAPIPVVLVLDSNGGNTTTSIGTFTGSYNYSVVVIYASSDGYQSTSRSYVMDEDRTATVYMVRSSTSENATLPSMQTAPKYITFHIKEGWGTPVTGVSVSIQGISTSTGTWDWVAQWLGLPLDEVPIQNTEMNQTTDTFGKSVFLVIPTGKYNVTFTKAGYTFSPNPWILVPAETDYEIWAVNTTNPSGGTFYEHAYDELASIQISVTSATINTSAKFVNISYNDVLGHTTGGYVDVLKKNDTPFGADTLLVRWPATSSTFTNSTVVMHVQQVSGQVKTNITHSDFGSVVRSYPFTFNSIPVDFLGFDANIKLLVALGIMILTAMLGTTQSARAVAIAVCIEGWFFAAIHMFQALQDRGIAGDAVMYMALVFMTLVAFLANVEVRKKKEKY